MGTFDEAISRFKLMLVGAMPFYGEIILRVRFLQPAAHGAHQLHNTGS